MSNRIRHSSSVSSVLYGVRPWRTSAIPAALETRPWSGIVLRCAGGAMPTREELEDEDRRVRQLRIAVNLALSVIGQTDMSLDQAQEMVAATRTMALRLFPG